MSVKFGLSDIKDAKLGNTQVKKIILGEKLVWQKSENGIRFIRDYAGGDSSNGAGNFGFWVEIKAMNGGNNVALGKTVTAEDSSQYQGSALSILTNGIVNTTEYCGVINNNGINFPAKVVVDLGAVVAVDSLVIWHYYADGRKFFNTKTEVSADGINWKTVFDSAVSGTYPETAEGHTINLN